MSLQQILVATSGTAKLFDSFSTSHLGIWSLQKERTDYTGYAVRAGLAADSGATTLDIGFLADGSFDMATYSAFGTGSERIVKWYDQSSNGFDLSRAWSATLCPTIRTSTYNNVPCIFFGAAGGSLGNAGFDDWSGLTDLNLFLARKLSAVYNGYAIANTAASRAIYQGSLNRNTWWGAIGSADNQFQNTINTAGNFLRCQFNGAGADDAAKGPLYLNTFAESRDTWDGTWPTTYPSGAGFYINGDNTGGNCQYSCEHFAVYYVGQALTAPQVTAINSSVNARFFTLTDSQLFCTGDSLTLNSANGGPSSSGAYANILKASLDIYTGTTWNLFDLTLDAEAAATAVRVLQINQGNANVLDQIDVHYPNHVVVAWAGTNDLATGSTAAAALTASVNLATASFNNRASVYYINMLPRQDLGAGNAAFEASRTTYNAGLVAALSGIATVVDIASISQLQDPTNTTYYVGDNVHLNDAGNALVAAAVAAAIEPNIV